MRWPTVCGLVGCLLAGGCANPGPPQPPSLHLPQPVTDLTVRRVGDALELGWTTPERSTDDLPLAGGLTAEVCEAPTIEAASCAAALTLPVRPGASSATLPLAAGAIGGPPALLVLRVRVRNAAGRSAEVSAPAFTAVGAAPPAVDGLRATAIEGGARLEWARVAGGAPVVLHRTLLTTATTATAANGATAGTAAGKKPGKHARGAVEVDLEAGDPQAGDPRATDVPRAGVAATGVPATDQGGMLDRTAVEDRSYRYTAERVRTVVLEGHAVSVRSRPSAAVTVRIHDVFPPAAPTGLASVPGGAGERVPAIELSWEANAEADLAGYLVERVELPAETASDPSKPVWTRITPTLLTAPTYKDAQVRAGGRYLYRVIAVDAAGNQSVPSAALEERAASL